jgi:tetratricopeptide (TPR) repeat protein
MNPKIKSLTLIAISLIISVYLVACSSTEQTTAMLSFMQGDYKKAEREFLKEVNQNPQNEEAWFYLALTRVQLQNVNGVDSAIKQYKKIGKNTYQSDLENEWGKVYDAGYNNFKTAGEQKDTAFALKLYKISGDDFKMALVLIPDSTFVQKNIDVINSRVNTIAIKPLIDNGVVLMNKEDFEGAVGQFKKALDICPKGTLNYEIVAYDLSICYLKWGEKIRDNNKESNPDDVSYKDKYKEGLPYLEDLTLSKDSDTQLKAWDLLVQVYGNLNMTDKAMDAIKKRDELKSKSDNKK